MFWGYRKGSKVNSNWKSIGIKYIKCYLLKFAYGIIVERNDIGIEYDLINDLGFNLCIAPWSLVMRLVAYFGVEESHQRRGPKEVE